MPREKRVGTNTATRRSSTGGRKEGIGNMKDERKLVKLWKLLAPNWRPIGDGPVYMDAIWKEVL